MDQFEGDAISSKFLQTCDIPQAPYRTDPFTMVIFGGGGDLSKRKLVPALLHLSGEDELPEGSAIIGFGRLDLSDEGYREMMKEAITDFDEEPFEEQRWNKFSPRLFFLSGHFENDEDYEKLREKLLQVSFASADGRINVIYYMAVPPQATPAIVEKLRQHDLCKGRLNARIIVEKPFGRDFPSAVALNKSLTDAFDEDQIYRIDHYLGKETVQNILFLRFSNSIFERLWDSRYIDHVQITVAEQIGVEHRGSFYEQTGVVRDIVQNHIMQLIALVAMEPPIGFDADFVRDEKTKIFRAIMPMRDDEIDKYSVLGQYGAGRIRDEDVPAYRDEKGVVPDSDTATFFAGKFYIANWRWAGVPFYVRTGKRLAKRITEICIQFKQPPLKLFGRTCDVLEPNVLVLTIQPEEKISLRFGVKYPHAANQIYPVNMVFGYQDTFEMRVHPAYERLLVDCMKGDLTLFVRQEDIEATWEVVDPVIRRWESARPSGFPNYSAGSWGPPDAQRLIGQEGRCWLTE